MKVKTTDLYHSAYLMAKGIPLGSMSVLNGGIRQKVQFVFSGNGDLGQLEKEYQQGRALINPVTLKTTILHLKEMMYDRLRSRKPHRDERRLRHGDQQRGDRGRQGFR